MPAHTPIGWWQRTVKPNSRTRPRVFVGRREISGYYAGLRSGFEELGVKVTRLTDVAHAYSYDEATKLERIVHELRRIYAKPESGIFIRALLRALERLLIVWVQYSHDVFIFGYGMSLNGIITGTDRFNDVRRMKAKKKVVIFVFHGSDVRPPWLSGANVEVSSKKVRYRTRQRVNRIREIEDLADHIVSHPPMSGLQSRKFVKYHSVGVPIRANFQMKNPRDLKWHYEKGRSLTTIVHAPSHSALKGSDQIEAVIKRLIQEGHLIEYTKLEGIENGLVLEALSKSDLLIDQLYSDTPMAHLSAEAAMVGCPAIICGNDLERLKARTPEADWPPTITGTPESLYDLTLGAITDVRARNAIGEAAQRFVSERWTARAVAERFLLLAKGDPPGKWYCDPTADRYWGGYGMSNDVRDAFVERVVRDIGDEWMMPHSDVPLPLPR